MPLLIWLSFDWLRDRRRLLLFLITGGFLVVPPTENRGNVGWDDDVRSLVGLR